MTTVTSLFSEIPGISWFSLIYSVLLLVDLLQSLGKKLPFREMITSIMGLQMLIGPFLEYYIFQFKILGAMNVPAPEYYAYALPCMIAMVFGLHLMYPNNNFEINLFDLLRKKRSVNERNGLILIGMGYVGYFVYQVFNVGSLDFVLLLFALSRFIGFMYLWVSGSRYTSLAFLLVLVPFIIQSINETILINLIVFLVILMTFYFMKYQVPKWKIYLLFTVSAAILIMVQSVKSEVRSMAFHANQTGNPTALFAKKIADQLGHFDEKTWRLIGGRVNFRLNQGWILGDILYNLENKPNRIKPAYFKNEVIGVILPRFLFPAKPIVGDHQKFYEFVGWKLNRKVAMSVGMMGDGYGNFGRVGGIIYCFFFGFIMGSLFKIWNRLGHVYPTLFLWGVLIFFYSMRAGDETYMIFNWMVKSAIFVLLYFLLFERNNSIRTYFTIGRASNFVNG